MDEAHGGARLVDVLAACAGSAVDLHLNVFGPEVDVDLSISGSTATVAVEVCTRPPDSVSGTRWTRWTPDSNLNLEYAPSPLTIKSASLTPPNSVSL